MANDTKYWFAASTEEFVPTQIVEQHRAAEAAGFDGLGISDHWAPWFPDGEGTQAWVTMAASGQGTSLPIGTGVTPVLHYDALGRLIEHPLQPLEFELAVARLPGRPYGFADADQVEPGLAHQPEILGHALHRERALEHLRGKVQSLRDAGLAQRAGGEARWLGRGVGIHAREQRIKDCRERRIVRDECPRQRRHAVFRAERPILGREIGHCLAGCGSLRDHRRLSPDDPAQEREVAAERMIDRQSFERTAPSPRCRSDRDRV